MFFVLVVKGLVRNIVLVYLFAFILLLVLFFSDEYYCIFFLRLWLKFIFWLFKGRQREIILVGFSKALICSIWNRINASNLLMNYILGWKALYNKADEDQGTATCKVWSRLNGAISYRACHTHIPIQIKSFENIRK